MEKNELKDILEVLFFITDSAVTMKKLREVFIDEKSVTEEMLREVVDEILKEHEGRPIELREVGGGFQFSTKQKYSPWVRRLFKEKTTIRMSPSAMETLSIVAYKQPVTRAEIEEIRGVETSGVIDTLLERRLIKMVGRKETVGRPLLYGTTSDFMRHFGLKNLSDLPMIEELTPSQNIELQQDLPVETLDDQQNQAEQENSSEK